MMENTARLMYFAILIIAQNFKCILLYILMIESVNIETHLAIYPYIYVHLNRFPEGRVRLSYQILKKCCRTLPKSIHCMLNMQLLVLQSKQIFVLSRLC